MFIQIPSIFTVLVLLVEVGQECLAVGERIRIEYQIPGGDRNALERKDMFVFVNKIDGRNLFLGNVPPKHS